MHEELRTESPMRRFFDGASPSLPAFYAGRIAKTLGSLAEVLPHAAFMYDENAYLNATLRERRAPVSARARACRT